MSDDYTSNRQTTGTVAVGGSASGVIETPGDRDWFAVTLEAGKWYRIDLEGLWAGGGTLIDPYLRGVHDADGALIAGTTDDNAGVVYNSRGLFTAGEDGTYYVAAGAVGNGLGTYTLSVTELSDDHAAGTGTGGTVAVGGSATGDIETPGDRDWFAVTLEAGKRYRIDLKGSWTEDGTLRDPYLHGVHDADGALIAGTTDDNAGAIYNSRVFFTAGEDGTYYVAAGAVGNGLGTYTLSVTEHSLTDDHHAADQAAGTGTGGTVAVGGSATGDIETRGDRDWFAVTLEAGKTYRIDLEGSWTGVGTLRDPYLRGVHDADGALIAGTTDDNSGTGHNSRVFFTAGEDGTYYVAAGADGNGHRGTYTLSVKELPGDQAAGTGTGGTVAVGGSATGDIEYAGDRDWFAVTLDAGKTYRIDLEGSRTGDGTLRDPYLRGVHDADGAFIAGTTDDNGGTGRNSRVFFTAGEDGIYYVAAGASANWHRGTYTLSVTEVPGDQAAGTGTGGTVAVGGSATGDIETRGDRDWFAVTLEANKTYRIDLEGSRTGDGTLSNPYLRGIHDADGVLIAGTTDDNGGTGLNSRVFFTAGEDGTYYVAAGAVGNRLGTYTLSVTELPGDQAAGTGTGGTVAVGGSATGDIEYAGDRDWFAVTLEANKTYRIDLEGSRTGDGTLSNPYLRGVHDADGALIAGTTNDNGGTGRNSRVFFTAGEDGTYYVAAGARANGHRGTYTLSVTEPSDDYAAGTGTSGTVAVGGSATGDIEYAGDRDWFAVTLEAGKTYRIDLEGYWGGKGTLRDPYLRGVHDADGALIAGTTNDDGVNPNSQVFFTAGEDGTYYVAAGASANGLGTYTLSVTEVSDDDHAAGTGTSGTVAVGGSATGAIETPVDRDWFAVTLEAGKWYRIDLEGWPTGKGTLVDPYLRGIHDADGALIAGTTDDNAGAVFNSRVFFTPGEDGTYYVAAGAGGAYGRNWHGTYTLSVRELPDDDYAAGTGTSGTVAVGGSATGDLETPGDRDWFAVTLEAGKTYRIDLEGSQTGKGTLYDPYLRGVHDADGALIAGTTDNDGGAILSENSRVFFTPGEDGTYYVAAGANWGYGTYTLSVTELSDDHAAGTGTSGTVAVDGSARGDIETPGDRDWFAVTLETGKPYRIDLEGWSTGDGTLFDPYLRGVHDADGALIAGTTNDDGGTIGNSRVFFTPGEDGTYYVAAGAAANWHGTGTYTLSVTDLYVPDDYSAGTGTSGTVAVGGSATGNIESSGDRDWFAVTLEAGKTYRIDLEGWPTGKGTLTDPVLRGVHDSDGALIAGTANDNGGAGYNSRVFFTPGEDGTYYVAASAGANWDRGSGTYTVSVTELSDDHAAGTGTSGTVAVGGSATGDIETRGDRDWFAVTLEADKTYRIDLEGVWTGGGTLADPYLGGVHDADGAFIAGTTNDNGGSGRNSRVLFSPGEEGTYYVAAGANWHLGTYTLSVEESI